ncbi:MAG: tetratricopeptide repeat protein [Candidatus Hodarchaeota archaeon]
MSLTDLTLKDLLLKNRDLTFLVGAGCSVDKPSCLPAGRAMMDSIINYTCASSEIDKIKSLKELRFEQIIEILRDRLDNDLKVIDYYGLCEKPNIQHFFLADMMKKENFVITTNFDFLIEYGLLGSEVPGEEIVPVITKEDFVKYDNPYEVINEGRKPIYKIHGSTRNIIENQSTRDSLIATIKAFGSNKEGKNVFQLESYKQPLFSNITTDRSLVIMGYSGSDDFDVVPTLKVLKNLRSIIWINHSENIKINEEKVKEIEVDDTKSMDEVNSNLKKVYQILFEIRRMNNADHVYLVDVNTSSMANDLIDFKPNISSENFSIAPIEWLKSNIEKPSEVVKYYIPYKIFIDFDNYSDALRCAEIMHEIAEKTDDQYWKFNSLSEIGEIFRNKGEYQEALKNFELALNIAEQLDTVAGKLVIFNNFSNIYQNQGKYKEALKNYEKALKFAEKLGDLSRKATILNNIGMIFRAKSQYDKALKNYQEALNNVEQLGDLSQKATYLINIGEIHRNKGNYPNAMSCYEEALEIAKNLGDLTGKSVALNNIGQIYRDKGKYSDALNYYQKSLKICEKLENLPGKATSLNNIASIYYIEKKYEEALEIFQEVYMIDEKIGNLSQKATSLNNIGEVYSVMGKYSEALKNFEEVLKIDEKLENLSGMAITFNNIGSIYYKQERFNEALKYYEKALNIDDKLGNLKGKGYKLWWIGTIYNKMNKQAKAIDNLEQALTIYKKFNLQDDVKAIQETLNHLKMGKS